MKRQSAARTRAPVHLSIFHTNDMHGRLEAMARLSAFARRLRAEAQAEGRAVFFWDAGDAADRRTRVCSITKGAAFSPILSAMGYTLQTMGNAVSLPYGPQALAAVAARADFPILAANCRDGDGPLPEGLREYALVPLPRGLAMGVFGLTAPWGGIYEIFGLHFPDFCDVARDLVARLRAQGAAPVVVLSHLGLEDDRRLAETVAGIDLIVGGHSHHRLPEGEECNGVLIAQAGEYAQALGRVDLALDPASGRVLARSAQVLDVPADEPPDPALLAAIAAAEREVDALMAQPVGVLESPLDLDHFRECGLGDLTADALRERMRADAAIVCGGHFHAPLPAGTVTLGQLDRACFSSANPCATGVRGAQIVAALERGLDPAICRVEHHGFRGVPIGIPQVSGIVVEYDPGAEAGRRVQRVTVAGRPLDPDRSYRLAHTDAETIPRVGYLVLGEGQATEHEVPTIVREVIEDYVRQHSPVPPPASRRWRPISSS
jgi:5'-nucleotidase